MRTLLLLLIAFLLVTAVQGQAHSSPAIRINPERQILSLEAPGNHQVTMVRIIDNDGFTVRTISTAAGSLLRFSISGLAPGRYLLRTNDPSVAETWFTKEKER
jgi:hypothetical protein